MVYQRKKLVDARSTIRSNDVQDARLHLNKTGSINKHKKKLPSDMRSQLKRRNTDSVDNKTVFDARQTISNITKQQTNQSVPFKETSKLATRNPPKLTKKEKISNTPIGFVSVTNGSRKLQEKVTMDSTGMKIAVRNDIVEETSLRQNTNEMKSNESKYHLVRTVPGSISTPNRAGVIRPRVEPTSRYHHHHHQDSRKENDIPDHSSFPRESHTTRRGNVTRPSRLSHNHHDTKPYHHHHQEVAPPRSKPKMEPVRKKPPPIKVESPPKSVIASCSPFQGTKILVSNLHPIVVEDDIMELFCAQGPVRRARLTSPGKAEVVFIRREDAITAYEKYNNRDLDGQPMQMKLLLPDGPLPSTPIYTWMEQVRPRANKPIQTLELNLSTLERALFKGGRTGTSSRPVVFTVKI